MKVFILASSPKSLINFRAQLIRDFLSHGFEVIVCAPHLTSNHEVVNWMNKFNVSYLDAPFERASISPFNDLKSFLKLYRILKKWSPDMFIAYTIKPVIWGGLAARLSKVPNRVSLITGLGYAFIGRAKGKRRFVRKVAQSLYGISLRGYHYVFFQNPDDKEVFSRLNLLPEKTAVNILNGSGVDTNYYSNTPIPKGRVVRFLLIARLVGDKGIREYAEAARVVTSRCKSYGVDLEFHLVGGLDQNPDALSETEVTSWVESGLLCWHGEKSDVRSCIAGCHVYVLPSYREGTPRSVLEAMSMGRAIITTDAPGCRETVVNGENGFLVDVQSVEQLVEAMERFIQQPELIETMGQRSRKLACEKYDVHKVNSAMMKAIGIIV